MALPRRPILPIWADQFIRNGKCHDSPADPLCRPAAKRSSPARATGAHPAGGNTGGSSAAARQAAGQPHTGPGSRHLPQHCGAGLWPAGGGGVSGAQGGGRQLRRPGGGAPRSAPAPVGGGALTPWSGDGARGGLPRGARGGQLLCLQPAGSPPLSPGTLGSPDAAAVAPGGQRLDELRGSARAWGAAHRHQQLPGAVAGRGVRAGADPDPHQLPAGHIAGDPAAHRCR
ncbi:hypothetical protein D3C76_432930 [compost metagenome]